VSPSTNKVTEGGSNDYLELETSGPRWRVIEATLAQICQTLEGDPAGRAWLASSVGFDRLNEIWNYPGRYFAVAAQFLNKDGSIDEVTEASTDDVPGYHAILNYAVFSANPPAYNWDTILHELAHILGCDGFDQNDGGDDAAAEAAQDANAALLRLRCACTLSRATGALPSVP
jgi:hypothetical protein